MWEKYIDELRASFGDPGYRAWIVDMTALPAGGLGGGGTKGTVCPHAAALSPVTLST